MTVVRVRAATKVFGRGVTALDAIDLDLHQNVIHGLLGRNGAGKTTLMRILSTRTHATSGAVEIFGGHPDEQGVRQRICHISEDQAYPGPFTVQHVLRAGELLHPTWDDDYARRLAADFGLPLRRAVARLSRGMRSALGIVVGLASRAPLTLFDEPHLGLDAVARQLFHDRLLADYAEHPRTVLLSTHLIDEVGDLLERVVMLDRGRVVLDDDAETLRGRAMVLSGPEPAVEAFIGGRAELSRERLGAYLRVTAAGPLDAAAVSRARAAGLGVEPVSLQQLFVLESGGAGSATELSTEAVPS